MKVLVTGGGGFLGGAIVRRLGVGHRADCCEAALCRGLRAARDRLLVLLTWLTQMRVQVDEAGSDHRAARINDLDIVAGRLVLHRQVGQVDHPRDLAVLYQHMADGRDAAGGVDDRAVLDQVSHILPIEQESEFRSQESECFNATL